MSLKLACLWIGILSGVAWSSDNVHGESAVLGAPVAIGKKQEKSDPQVPLGDAAATKPNGLTVADVEEIVRRQLRSEGEKTKGVATKEKQADKPFVVGQNPDFKSTWRNGFFSQTDDQSFRFHVGGLIHAEAGWWQADPDVMYGPGGVGPLNDGAMFRRARLHVLGTMYEVVDWTMEVGFENRLPQFFNVYMDLTHLPFVQNLRMGHFREPFGMDALTSYNNLTFLERDMVLDPFVPFFNMGAMLHGPLFDEKLTYATGIFRTNSDAFNAADFGDGSYAYTSRVTFNPWYREGEYAFHLAGAYSYRVMPFLNAQGQPAATGGRRRALYQARPEDRVNAPFFIGTGVIDADRDNRFGAELGVSVGRFLLQAEYNAVAVGETAPPQRHLLFQGGYVQASWFLTGEHRPYVRREGVFGAVRPYENFFLVRGEEDKGRRILLGRGAWEVACRYSQVDLDSAGLRGGSLRAVTLGLNWYLNPNCRLLWNYLLTWRETAASQSDGLVSTFGARFQVEF